MSWCELTERCCENLASVLQSQHSSLRELVLSDNSLGDSGVKLLSAALREPNCKLTTLKIRVCKLTERCCEDLTSALQSQHSSLRELDLSGNNLGDSGVKLLSAALRDPNCKLTTLGLGHSACLPRFRFRLHRLQRFLAWLPCSGDTVFSRPCRRSQCELMQMRYCKLTERCCEDLASALQSQHSSLRELDLSGNNLGDSGVKLLSAALNDPNCKLTTLK
ncbi:NAL12 protein, partial [Atractosteus spatula]|nr:NAL12 protein [Atractosteus spatula]